MPRRKNRAARRATPMRCSPRRRRPPSSSAGACGRRATAARRPPTAMRRWDRTTRPAASTAPRSAPTIASRRLRSPALRSPAAAPISASPMAAAAAPTCSRPAPSFATLPAPAYISGALAYGWQDITTDRTVTVAGIDQLRAEFNANAFSGRAEGGYRFVTPVDGRHRHHALCRRTVHHLRSAGLCRAGGHRRQHLCARLWRQERHRSAQRTRHSHRQILRDAGRHPHPCAVAWPGRTISTPTAISVRRSRRCRAHLRRQRRGASERLRAVHRLRREEMAERLVRGRHLRRRVLQRHHAATPARAWCGIPFSFAIPFV